MFFRLPDKAFFFTVLISSMLEGRVQLCRKQ